MDKKNLYIILGVVVAIVIIAAAAVALSGNNNNNDSNKVTYNGNGGTYEGQTTMSYNSNTVMPCVFTNGSYMFESWNTKADGTGTTYASGDSVNYGVTLYAQWTSYVTSYTYMGETITGLTFQIDGNTLFIGAAAGPHSEITIAGITTTWSHTSEDDYFTFMYDHLMYKATVTVTGSGVSGISYSVISGTPTVSFDTTSNISVTVDIELLIN